MREGVLFEITKDNIETGLRGIPVGYCTTSRVDPQKGLYYVGRPVAELAFLDPIEVIYLLYYGEMGNREQLETFRKNINQRSHVKAEALRHIESLPREGAPMDLLAAALLIASSYEGTNDYREDCLNIIAKIPVITAALINGHAGWGTTPPSRPELGYMENFVHMLACPKKKEKEWVSAFRLFDILSFDHGGGNLSTFVGKAIASSLENMYGSLAGAMTALAGERHGRANQDCLEFVQGVLDQVGENATEPQVEALLRQKMEKNELIFGFGHAVLRVEDPRASVCYDYCKKHFSHNPLVKIASLLRSVGPRVLKENPKIADPYPNIDAITGTLLHAAGFCFPEYFTVLFGLSRCVGISIQIVYERLEARGGKGLPIVRPAYLYKAR